MQYFEKIIQYLHSFSSHVQNEKREEKKTVDIYLCKTGTRINHHTCKRHKYPQNGLKILMLDTQILPTNDLTKAEAGRTWSCLR